LRESRLSFGGGRSGLFPFRGRGIRRISTILLIALLVTIGLFGLRGSVVAEPPPSPLSQTFWIWGTNVKVNDDPGTTGQSYPSIAVDGSGNAYAVWGDGRNGNYDIYFSYRPAGGSWGANVKVNDGPGASYYSEPDIVVDASGNAYVVWHDERNGNLDIYFSYRPAGGSWGVNVKVNDDLGTAAQAFPSIAVDASGNAYAAWTDYRTGGGDIYFSYRPAGGSWGTNVKVNDGPGSTWEWEPDIATDSSGNAYAIWRDSRLFDDDIYFSYRPADGSWGANVKVNDDLAPANQWSPSVAVDASGNAYAVWWDYRNGNGDIYFSYRPAGGSWGVNLKVSDDPGTAVQGLPAIAVDATGNAYAVWTDGRDPMYREDIYFSYRPAAGNWEANVWVNDDLGSAIQLFPAIAVDGRGNAYAVWEDEREGDSDIYFSYGWEPTSFVYLPIIMKNY